MTILITTCSKRKQLQDGVSLEEGITFKTQDELLKHWCDKLSNVDETSYIEAALQYKGRGFKQALNAMQGELSKLFIISAGLGLVRADDQIPAYNFTVSSGSEDIKHVLPYVTFDGPKWFTDMCNTNVTTAVVEASGTTHNLQQIISHAAKTGQYVILALSKPYLKLVLNELIKVHKERPGAFTCVRLIGGNLEAIAPFWMFDHVMPYTANASGVTGARIDFAQRATHHFIKEILPNVKPPSDGYHSINLVSPQEHARLVYEKFPEFLKSSFAGSLNESERKKLTEEELLAWITEHWDECFGAKTRMLFTLRKGHGISCSVERFNAAFSQVLDGTSVGGGTDV